MALNFSLRSLKISCKRERDVKHIRTSIYHPEGNGAVGSWNKALKDAILNAQRERTPWTSSVVEFLQTYTATPHATTGTSPFELLFGRKMRTKLSILTPCNITPATRKLRTKVKKKQLKMKAYVDTNRKAKIPKLRKRGLCTCEKTDTCYERELKIQWPYADYQEKRNVELRTQWRTDMGRVSFGTTAYRSQVSGTTKLTTEYVDRPAEGQCVRKKPMWLKYYRYVT